MNKIRILFVETVMDPVIKEIENTKEKIQKIIGRPLHFIKLENGIILICNKKGKLLNLEINKIIKNDVICGNFIICGQEDENFISLTDKQLIKYKKYFKEKYHTIPKALIMSKYKKTSNLIKIDLNGVHKLLNLINHTNMYDE